MLERYIDGIRNTDPWVWLSLAGLMAYVIGRSFRGKGGDDGGGSGFFDSDGDGGDGD
ncbi:hypothetical protein [Thioclava pacifica]|uniref:Uncharacterized protein n=1 Tax=Thioclava pacifica DSM 10166 TaxID=1353537 RepID=A0A074JEB7_9RHOB|nr:hypothetical protein [Thioclava pacifica]KEO55991.1 hypothetical protein TP2_00295 [Thioclava pacifica DSM 10166]